MLLSAIKRQIFWWDLKQETKNEWHCNIICINNLYIVKINVITFYCHYNHHSPYHNIRKVIYTNKVILDSNGHNLYPTWFRGWYILRHCVYFPYSDFLNTDVCMFLYSMEATFIKNCIIFILFTFMFIATQEKKSPYLQECTNQFLLCNCLCC